MYDPLGWIAPIIIQLKIFMQSLWMLTKDWALELPEEYASSWRNCYGTLTTISKIRVPRWLGVQRTTKVVELHGFADASKRAYAGVLYLRVIDEEARVCLIAAKSKVAPIKTLSIPRLELCAAHLVTKFTKFLLDRLNFSSVSIHLWTDSKDVLYWLRDFPAKWPTFVANRTADVSTMIPGAFWHHVRSAENPADVATRSCTASDLLSNDLWWKGPDF